MTACARAARRRGTGARRYGDTGSTAGCTARRRQPRPRSASSHTTPTLRYTTLQYYWYCCCCCCCCCYDTTRDASLPCPQKLTHTHTHQFNGPFSGTTRVSRYRKVKTVWISLKQETVSGGGISWAICKSAPRSRQITMPAPHHSVFYRPDALLAAKNNTVKALKALENGPEMEVVKKVAPSSMAMTKSVKNNKNNKISCNITRH